MSIPDPRLKELYDLRYNLVNDLYRRRARALEVAAQSRKTGLDTVHYYVYKVFGTNLFASIAFALDPFWQFQKLDRRSTNVVPYRTGYLMDSINPVSVVPVNRTRRFLCMIGYDLTAREYHRLFHSTQTLYWNGSAWAMTPVYIADQSNAISYSGSAGKQGHLYGYCLDTTQKTRNPKKPGPGTGSGTPKAKDVSEDANKYPNHQGEMELYVPDFVGNTQCYDYDEYNVYTVSTQALTGYNGEKLVLHDKNIGGYYAHLDRPWATVDSSAVNSYAATEKAVALASMSKNVDALLAKCVPGRRYYNLIYQLVELRDLPRTLKGTLAVWIELERALGTSTFKDIIKKTAPLSEKNKKIIVSFSRRLNLGSHLDQKISDVYLNFKFGWESMVSAVNQLAYSPEKAAKEINRLINLNGKNATLRTRIQYREPVTSFPSITFFKFGRTTYPSSVPTVEAYREVEIRCSVNSGINFPKADIPKLRKDLWNSKLGIVPTPGDLYDLVPWTWMVDWATGAGEYIHLMDSVSSSKSLINYGLISYISKTKVTATLSSYVDSYARSDIESPPSGPTITTRKWVTQKAEFSSKFHLRKDLSAFAGVSTYSGKGASPYQVSILTALFSKFGK